MSTNSSIHFSSIKCPSLQSTPNSSTNYTSDSIKLLLKNDNENYKIIPNQSKRVSAAFWKEMDMGFPAKKVHDKDEFIAIPGFVSCSKCFDTYRYVDSSTTHIKSHKCLNSLPSNQTSLDDHFRPKSLGQPNEQRTIPITKAVAKRKEEMKKVCARWIAHSMRSFTIVQDPGFKAVVDECLKIGREFRGDTVLSSDDIISCDRTIKNEIKKLATNERLLLKDRLLGALEYGGLCISPDICEFTFKKKSGDNIMKLLRKELISFGLENSLNDIVFVTDRGSNFVKGLDGFTVLFCTAHRLNNILKLTFYQNFSKEKGSDRSKTTTTIIERTEKTPNKTTTTKTTIQASPEIHSEVEITDDEDNYDTNESETDDDIDYSSVTISSLPPSAKEILNTIHYCKALVKYTKKSNLNRLIQTEKEEDYSPTADENKDRQQSVKSTTLHQSSVVRWLSFYDLLSSIEKAYHPLKNILNEKQESSRIEKINMSIVAQLIKFLEPWRYVMKEIQLSNSPSLFLTLPCVGYLKQEIKRLERTMRGGKFVSPLLEIYIFMIYLSTCA
ncbi:unnamed protein product [Rotaria sordida]|uniref:C2H2-type domain-containing protein n=1 Tax=Rotaria sordida TaxID=392033 RepID=A0A815FXL8_9BILA|nr:unnamed protein product [Rotaria sordida]CAF1346267.1 unnamed protein product [Rotaria sordida]CAF3795008.1 unnamed protein product [Rotaria sordida]CAF3795022.1 unnamed protein product [Rotaria sordida]